MKILLHAMRWKPLMELPKTPSPFTMLRAWVLIVFTCVVQSSRGVKKTPRYLRVREGLIMTSVPSGSQRLILLGGDPCLTSCFDIRFGWKNIISHLSLSMEKLESRSQENTW